MFASAPSIRSLEQTAIDRWQLCLDNGSGGVTVINVDASSLTRFYRVREVAAQHGLWLLHQNEDQWAQAVAVFLRQQQGKPSGDIVHHANGGMLPRPDVDGMYKR